VTAVRGTGLVLLTLVAVAVPRLAASAVVVAEPTGDADPAFLAELKASLLNVATGAPAELDAELRASAMNNEAGLKLVVELMLNDGKEPIRDTRIVTKASALSQARAMGRGMIRSLIAPTSSRTTIQTVVVEEKSPVEPPKTPLPEKYSRRKALRMTVLPTVLLAIVGGGLTPLFIAGAPLSLGIIVAGTGVAVGPSIGYFWIGRWQHALGMIGLRVLALGLGATFMGLYISSIPGDSDSSKCQDGDGNVVPGCKWDKSTPGFLVVSIISLTTSLIIAVVDAALVGRAADRANAEWREKNKPTVQVTPVAWTSGNGDATYGLALQGTF
jgi:hypothetical protein